MRNQRSNVIGVMALLLLATSGAAFAAPPDDPSRVPQALLPRVANAPNDGNGPTTQWRVPDNNLTPAGNAIASALEQVINTWAQAVDSQDPNAVASLFTVDGVFALVYNNTTTAPWTQAPTGYSPSSSPTGGTAGGGCTAVGQTAIANYVRGTGLAAGYNWPNLSQSRTILLDTLPKLGADASTASSHSYLVNGTWSGGNSNQQIFVTYRNVPGQGWKISQLLRQYATAQPTLPCQN